MQAGSLSKRQDLGMRKNKKTIHKQSAIDAIYSSVKEILERARSAAYQSVNFAMVQAYWNIGKVIFEE